ncbi:YobI family P-loop NTPase [Flavobacterium bernardetii]|uniref:YobI family P-loop NTPase n=1 Tax=Flavobacterium bernardetii TaxID=2813823 RepID=UPI00374418BF
MKILEEIMKILGYKIEKIIKLEEIVVEATEINIEQKTKGYFKIYTEIVFNKYSNRLKQIKNNLICKLGYPININNNSFEDLTPVIVNNGNIYIDSLFWALKNKNVKNIALTGSYGSGKSSILKTFKEKHPEFEYLNISLATFDDLFDKLEESTIQSTKLDSTKSDEINKKIELSILQQMLYVEKSSTIPNSRFQRIKNLKNHSIYINSIFCLTTVLAYIFLFHNTLITKLNCVKFYFFESKNCEINFKIFEILSIISLFLGAFYIIKSFVKTVNDFKFNKINLKGEVELNREVTDNSILNKNIDEIIYFFERTKYNVVLIEDLDRFQEPEIFTKLREINLLINISKQVNRHIVFIYALKDEMFKNSDRTKFFDFILPIIPVINSSNSYDFLLEKLKNDEIDKNLLYDISLYIDDMRLLKNIINEYKIYHDKLTKETEIELIPNKLLSFIIYKNLFPKDFAILHKNEGMIYEVFNIDLKTIKQKQTEIEEQKIIDNNNEITKLKDIVDNKTKINNIKDLRKLYISELFKLLPNETTSIIIKEKTYFLNQIDKLIEEDVFEEIRKTKVISYTEKFLDTYLHRINTVPTEMDLSFEKIESKVDLNYNYDKRVEFIFEKENKDIEKLKNLNRISNEEINKIKSYSLHKILTKNKNSDEQLNVELKKSDVLVYFISNGFIAEDYFDYISIFKEGDISRNDKNFILSIRNNNALQVDFKLDKIENLIKHLENDFHKNEILNIQFIDYLLEKEIGDFDKIFIQFNDENERTKEFIELYVKTGKHIEKFVKTICLKYSNFWNYIDGSNLTNDNKDFILKPLLMNVSPEILKIQDKDKKLSNYISKKSDFLNLIHFENKNIENSLLILKIKFISPLDSQVNQNLFDFIYKNNLYELNIEMIKQIIFEKTEEEILVSDLEISNYTTILNSKCEFLIYYIEENIKQYITNVFLNLENNTKESEKFLINLINNPKLNDQEQLYEIIKYQDVVFENIEDIKNPESWINLFSLSKIKPTWLNVFKYYEKYNFDEFLIPYLNIEKNYLELSKIDIKSTSIKEEMRDEFIENLILTDEISDIAYLFLIKNIEDSYDELEIENIGETKITMLIEKGIIALRKENFELLRENFSGKQTFLIKLNFDEYIKQRDEEVIDYELEEKEYESLLSSNLTQENKIEIITEISENQISKENNLGNLIGEILKSHSAIALSYSYFINLLQNITSLDTKVKLCNIYFNLFSSEVNKIETVLALLSTPFKEIIEVGLIKPPIKNNENNLKFIENLRKIKFISSYSAKDDKITKIRRK